MSAITLESLKEQLKATELEHEGAKAILYRTDGVIQLLKHQIKQLETVEEPPDEGETPENPAVH